MVPIFRHWLIGLNITFPPSQGRGSWFPRIRIFCPKDDATRLKDESAMINRSRVCSTHCAKRTTGQRWPNYWPRRNRFLRVCFITAAKPLVSRRSLRADTSQNCYFLNGLSAPCGIRQFFTGAEGPHPSAQVRAALSVNRELVVLYWSIGRDILNRQEDEGWGTKIIDRLSKVLTKALPDMRGFRARNLNYMRAFAEAYEAPHL